jgi:hypothetical protein
LNPFSVGNSEKVYDLDSTVGLGVCVNAACDPLTLHYSSKNEEQTIDAVYDNEISINSATVSAKNLHFRLDVLSGIM